KGKEIVDIAAQIPSSNTIVPGMFKLDLEPLAPRLLQNREAHIDYLKYTQEQADILQEIELLIYARDTCPNAIKLNAKKIAVTPKNNVKKVRIEKSMFNGVHDMCLLDFVENGNSHAKSAKKHKKQNIWKPTGHVFTKVGLKWKPIGKTFTIVGNSCPLTRITSANVVPPKKTTSHSVETQKSELKVVQIVLWYLDSGCSKHMTGNRSQLINIVSKFMGTIRFRNDHIARIMGYGDYQLGNITISILYYVEGLGHNLFSVSQFCDADLEVAFQKNTCFIRNLEGVDLLLGSRDTNLYTISLDGMLKTSPIYLLSFNTPKNACRSGMYVRGVTS
ncbi:hypothetical protein Tco_0046635, partial [Tanacetum coccineum]